jgi:hypothetical protein
MYREIEGTGDLNGAHGVGSTISSVTVQKREHILKCVQRVFLKMKICETSGDTCARSSLTC